MGSVVSWSVASAGIGALFGLLTYMHGNFISTDQMKIHVEQPHKHAVNIERYTEDIRYIRAQMTEINRKLDRAIKH